MSTTSSIASTSSAISMPQNLPDVLLANIFDFIPSRDIFCDARYVNQQWRKCCSAFLNIPNTQITATLFKSILSRQTRLHTLTISSGISDAYFEHLKDAPLKRLVVNENPQFDGSGLRRLSRGSLTDLSVMDCDQFKLSNCTDLPLEHLQLTGVSQWKKGDTESLTALPYLKSLNLSRTPITGDDLRQINEMPQLTSLNLTDCRALKNSDLCHLKSNPSLRILILDLCDISELSWLNSLALEKFSLCEGIGSIKSFDLPATIQYLDIRRTRLPAEQYTSIFKLVHLKTLRLGACDVPKNQFIYLRDLKELTDLDIGYSSTTNEVLFNLSNLRLTHLRLEGCKQIDKEGIQCLSSIVSLTSLNLCRSSVDDDAIGTLTTLSLTNLNLSDCQNITSAVFPHLQKMHKLQELNIAKCKKISRYDIAKMKKPPKLIHLTVSSSLIDAYTAPAFAALSLVELTHIYG